MVVADPGFAKGLDGLFKHFCSWGLLRGCLRLAEERCH